MERLGRRFFVRDSVTVARALLGQRLVRIVNGIRLAGAIVETEAYLGVPDRAAHTFGGRRTDRNASMWLTGGHTYVYFTYGLHHCLNVVAGQAEDPIAVLIRAVEPTEGLETMRQARPKAKQDKDLCSGPARLCEALRIDRDLDGIDLVQSSTLWLERARARSLPARLIGVSARVGVGYAGDWAQRPLRFFVAGHPHVSPGKPTVLG